MPVALSNVASGYNLSVINENFQKLQTALNNNLLWRNGYTPGETLMNRDLDMNSNDILNAYVNGESLDDLVTDVKDVLALFDALQQLAQQLSKGASRVVGIPSIQTLRLTPAAANAELVFLQNYYVGVKGGEGFFFYDSADTTSPDNGGSVIVNNLGQRWKRLGTGPLKAEWFGVRVDGVACGDRLQAAITWVATNGGILELPEGEINMGTTRIRVDWFSGVKAFTLKGNNSSIVPENVDPPATIPPGSFYQSEASLFVFTADTIDYQVGYMPQIIIEGITLDYRNQRNKGGPTFETMGDSCHPTPYSDGLYGMYFSRVLRPVIRNCTFKNIYGDGILIKRCADFELRNNNFFNVSANQILRSDGSTATDHRGYACAAFGSSGVMDNNFVHNERVYTVNVTVDGVNVNGSLCGYIGLMGEFAMNYPFSDAPSRFAPPLHPWYYGSTASTYSDVNPDSMIVMTNNRIYGYVIGLKAESNCDVAMIGNRVFNCYIPIDSVSCSTTIENNWVDQLPTTTNPQNGLRFYQACILLSDFGQTLTAGMMAVVRNNRIFTKTLAAFGIYRNDAVIDSNQIRVSGEGTMWKQVDSKTLRNIKVTNNVFRVMQGAYTQSVVTNMTRYYQFTLSGNRFINETSFSIGLVFNGFTTGTTNIHNNHFDGQSYVQIAGRANVSLNRFENTSRVSVGTSGSDYGPTVIENNHFECLTGMTQSRIGLSVGDVTVRGNTFNLTFDTTRTIPGLISATNTMYNVEISKNRVIESGTSENFALINTGTMHNLIFKDNYGSGGRGYFLGSPSFGPFTVEGNIGFVNGIMTGNSTDPNAIANLSPTYTPSIGSKVNFLRPVAGGAEGVVYTSAGWKTFGSISA